jgi:hypothetical protein
MKFLARGEKANGDKDLDFFPFDLGRSKAVSRRGAEGAERGNGASFWISGD